MILHALTALYLMATTTVTSNGRTAEASITLSVNVIPSQSLAVNEIDMGDGLVLVQLSRNGQIEASVMLDREERSNFRVALVDDKLLWSMDSQEAFVWVWDGDLPAVQQQIKAAEVAETKPVKKKKRRPRSPTERPAS